MLASIHAMHCCHSTDDLSLSLSCHHSLRFLLTRFHRLYNFGHLDSIRWISTIVSQHNGSSRSNHKVCTQLSRLAPDCNGSSVSKQNGLGIVYKIGQSKCCDSTGSNRICLVGTFAGIQQENSCSTCYIVVDPFGNPKTVQGLALVTVGYKQDSTITCFQLLQM